MKNFDPSFVNGLALLACLFSVGSWSLGHADERTLTPEQMEKLAKAGELAGETGSQRPTKLPDLTKGDPIIGERLKQHTWHLGPTGLIGYMPGGLQGDQIEVTSVLAGSPAEGKLQWGDVILGVNGTRFSAGQNMGMLLGKQIIESERAATNGLLKLIVWRDANFSARNGRKDIAGVDIDKLIDQAASDASLYDWKPKEERAKEVRGDNFDEFPIDSKTLEITLQLEVLPDYSDSSPYDCPKAERIREDAWQVIEKQFQAGKVRADRRGTIMALALVASGKPEHRELVRQWVRSPAARAWHPSVEGSIDMMQPRGYFSWFMSFDALDCALYYDATGDEFVLPALREYAIKTAMGQAGGGSWGHTFAWPAFNGGELHGMNPGYGALNAAGNRCFFLIALAQKVGVKHPEIDLAVKRAHHFFGSYVDKGGIPYGMHGAAATDDSNGKNTGVAFALKQLGDDHGAKYFAQMSTHASFTRRAGHGNDYFWHWSPWAATLCGPKGTIATHRNLRWRFTLCRRFDGAFVIQSPTGGIQSLRDPTATFALHYSAPLKQTLITGKDVDPSYAWTESEMDHLMTSALPQLNDPILIRSAGMPYAERTTDDLFEQLDMFKPKARGLYAGELGRRYQAGETEILPRLVDLLESDDPRFRGSGCRGLAACGSDATLQYMSKVARLLNDPNEFVRIQAMATMTKASNSQEIQLKLLNATLAEHGDDSASPNNFLASAQNPLFGVKDSMLAESPFDTQFDPELVQAVLEKLLDLDPIGNRGFLRTRGRVWSRETVVRLAGPLTFVAEEEQTSDQMFAGRNKVGQAILSKYGYYEAIQAGANYLRKQAEIARDLRPRVTFKRALVDVDMIQANPGACHELLDALKLWLADDPLAVVVEKKGEATITTRVQDLITLIEAAEPVDSLPRLADDVQRLFLDTLGQAAGVSEKINLCREELGDPDRKNFFRKIAAMDFLAEKLGPAAIDDLIIYLGHDYWRLRQHSYSLVVKLSGKRVTESLLSHFEKADRVTAAAILVVLGERGDSEALPVVRRILVEDAANSHGQVDKQRDLASQSDVVRAAAVTAMMQLDGASATKQIFTRLRGVCGRLERQACERALIALSEDPEVARQVQILAISELPELDWTARNSLYWVLSQLGGEKNLSALEIAIETAGDEEFRELVYALSWSPDERASELLLKIIKTNLGTPRAQIAAREGVRRMVIGADDIGNLSNQQRLDYADPLLNMVLDRSTVTYLGGIRSGRCASILQRTMRRGEPEAAAKAIIAATTNLTGATEADRKLGTAALIDTIEFIEVTQLRGGVSNVLQKSKEARSAYPMWKTLSAQAGKNLLKLDKPAAAPLPEFDDLDLDF